MTGDGTTGASEGTEIDDEMLDLYALGALDEHESALVAAAVASHASLAQRLARTEEALAILGASITVDPPPSMRAAVLGALGDVPQEQADAARPSTGPSSGPATVDPPPADELAVRRGRRAAAPTGAPAAPERPAAAGPSRRSVLRYAAAAAAVGVVGAGGWTLWRSLGDEEVSVASVEDRIRSASDARVVPASDASGAWSATELHWSPSVGEAVITTSEPLPEVRGGVYQLWRIAEEGSAPRPAGELDATGGGVLVGGLEGASVVAVSRESGSGATTPTTPLLATYAIDA